MGQGTESAGGYGYDVDLYDEALESQEWIQKDGSSIHISDMSNRHLTNTTRLLSRQSCSNSDLWDSWLSLMQEELDRRKLQKQKLNPPSKQRGTMITMICKCGKAYIAREADLKRGWGKSCSKACAAKGNTKGKGWLTI